VILRDLLRIGVIRARIVKLREGWWGLSRGMIA
jgi:hypothetical protein